MDGSNKKTRIPFELPSEASVPSDIYTILLLVYCRNQQTNIDISLVRTVIAQLREPHSFFNNKAATALITSKAASPNNAVILPLGRPPAYWGGVLLTVCMSMCRQQYLLWLICIVYLAAPSPSDAYKRRRLAAWLTLSFATYISKKCLHKKWGAILPLFTASRTI